MDASLRSEVIFDLAHTEQEIEALDKHIARHDFWDNIDDAQEVLKRRAQLQVILRQDERHLLHVRQVTSGKRVLGIVVCRPDGRGGCSTRTRPDANRAVSLFAHGLSFGSTFPFWRLLHAG